MTVKIKALLATGALLLSSGAALAANATATTNVNVRSGPGQSYEVIDVLPEGETVNLVGCDDAWCEISMGREGTGYALADLLEFNGRVPAASFGGGSVVIEEDDPIVVRGLVIGGYWDNRPYYIRDGYYYWGGRWYGARPGLRGWRERSWKRWDDRRPWGDRDKRWAGGRTGPDGRSNAIPRQDSPFRDRDRPGRPDDRPRGGGDGWGDRGDRADRGDRGGGRDRDGGGRPDRMERGDRGGGGARAEAPRDRGDRMGLDRAGGGGRGDGGGRDR